jgi:histone-lysine N-methyltransferase SETMAR
VQLPHPPYSPDLAPSDFYLFRHLKKFLRGRHFRDNEDLQGATEAWLGGRDKEFFEAGLVSLQDKWNKCIEVKGDYIEK